MANEVPPLSGSRARKSVVIDPRDEARIGRALEGLASSDDFAGLRTRAFVYLLWDGALRTKAAVWLNAEEVVKDAASSRVHIVREAVQRPCGLGEEVTAAARASSIQCSLANSTQRSPQESRPQHCNLLQQSVRPRARLLFLGFRPSSASVGGAAHTIKVQRKTPVGLCVRTFEAQEG